MPTASPSIHPRAARLATAAIGAIVALSLADAYFAADMPGAHTLALALLAFLAAAFAWYSLLSRHLPPAARHGDAGESPADHAPCAESCRLNANLFAETRESIVVTDARARIVDINPAFTAITGYRRDEVLGKNPSLLKSGHQDADFYAAMWCALAETGHWQGEIWNRRKNGEVYAEDLVVRAVRDDGGRITHYLGLGTDITDAKLRQDAIEHLANYDPLTRLPNRTLLADRMQQALARAERDQVPMAVCYLDLDHFKPLNDRHGRAAGDRILRQVAQRLEASMQAQDTIARPGGDEFVLFLSDLDSIEESDLILARIAEAMRAPFEIEGEQTADISASIGVALYPADGNDVDTLLRHANQAMYLAKQAGRNRIHLYGSEQDELARERRDLRTRIGLGLEKGEFALYWQPRVDMRDGRVIGAEALLRWPQADGSVLGPDGFLPHFEHDDLIVAIGDWALAAAMRQLAEWKRQGLDLQVSVNIAARHLQSAGFAERLAALLQAHPDVSPAQFELEVLETAALQDLQHVSRLIDACRAMGFRFALDDFGTGYSSITYFRRLPIDIVKIDQSFVRDMLDDPEDMTIVAGILGMTAAFAKTAVAEGVESVEHGIALLGLGCPLAQGYAIAPPLPAGEMAAWVRAYRPPPAWGEYLAGKARELHNAALSPRCESEYV